MSRGLPYDSAGARAYAGAITALMTGWAYRTSAAISRDVTGPFDGYPENREPFLGVMEKHRRPVDKIDAAYVPADLMTARATPGTRRSRSAGSTASATARPRCWRRPGPSAS